MTSVACQNSINHSPVYQSARLSGKSWQIGDNLNWRFYGKYHSPGPKEEAKLDTEIENEHRLPYIYQDPSMRDLSNSTCVSYWKLDISSQMFQLASLYATNNTPDILKKKLVAGYSCL